LTRGRGTPEAAGWAIVGSAASRSRRSRPSLRAAGSEISSTLSHGTDFSGSSGDGRERSRSPSRRVESVDERAEAVGDDQLDVVDSRDRVLARQTVGGARGGVQAPTTRARGPPRRTASNVAERPADPLGVVGTDRCAGPRESRLSNVKCFCTLY
jgi:hypothetical protein